MDEITKMNPVLENIMTRRSVRAFTKEPIPREILALILKAGSYAANGMGGQTWKFTAVQNSHVLEQINKVICGALLAIPLIKEIHPHLLNLIKKAEKEDANFLYNAPTCIIITNLRDNGNGMPDSALAAGNMMLAAHSLGIGSCWLNQLAGLTYTPQIRTLLATLGIPDNHIVYGALVMGYAALSPRNAPPRKNVYKIID